MCLCRRDSDLPDLLKVTIVKDKEIFVLVIQALDVVGNTLGEVPDITSIQDLGCPAAILVNSRQEKGAFIDETPFSLFSVNITPTLYRSHFMRYTYHSVPVELSDGTLDQMLLGTGDVMTLRQVCDNLLPSPTTREDVGL